VSAAVRRVGRHAAPAARLGAGAARTEDARATAAHDRAGLGARAVVAARRRAPIRRIADVDAATAAHLVAAVARELARAGVARCGAVVARARGARRAAAAV